MKNEPEMSENTRILRVMDYGRVPYHQAWAVQKRFQQERVSAKLSKLEPAKAFDDLLLFVEHPHVYTLGKSGDKSNMLISEERLRQLEAEWVPIDRGGDITYHGPGQIVGYPIIDLDHHFTDIHRYLRSLEEVIIRTCRYFGVESDRMEGLTGVWVEDRKICAFGVKCSRWVTLHGFALNVSTDLSYFTHIVPCGIQDKQVTSLEKELGTSLEMDEVKRVIAQQFEEVFTIKAIGFTPEWPESSGEVARTAT